MLDNFGLMEFLTLALMALLLFGPERLPQMAARLGRWLASLTRYSKAFMAQWSEEAMAIQDAVAEVRGIRDEILSAQQELAGSLATAREDINGAIGDARATVSQLTPNPEAFLEGAGASAAPAGSSTARAAAATSQSDDGAAIAKSQQVLDDFLKRRAATPAPPATTEGSTAEPAPSPVAAEQAPEQATQPVEPAPEQADPSKLSQQPEAKQQTESAFDRTQRVINKLLGKEEPVAPPVEAKTEMQPVASEALQSGESIVPLMPPLAEPVASEQRATTEQPAGAEQMAGAPMTQVAAAEPPKVHTESAFEKTQRVLNRLRGTKEPPEAAPVAERPVLQPISDAVQQVTQPVTPAASRAAEPAQGVGVQSSSLVSAPPGTQRVEAPGFTVSYSRFEELSLQVAILQRELKALRTELQSIRATRPQPVGELADRRESGPPTGESAATNSASMPVEENG